MSIDYHIYSRHTHMTKTHIKHSELLDLLCVFHIVMLMMIVNIYGA